MPGTIQVPEEMSRDRIKCLGRGLTNFEKPFFSEPERKIKIVLDVDMFGVG